MPADQTEGRGDAAMRLAIPFSILMAFASCAWVLPEEPQSSIEIEVGPPQLLTPQTNCDVFTFSHGGDFKQQQERIQRCVGKI